MSQLGIIEQTEDDRCKLCGKVEETRPYGPRGEEVCFECGMKDEETAKRKFFRHVLGEESQ